MTWHCRVSKVMANKRLVFPGLTHEKMIFYYCGEALELSKIWGDASTRHSLTQHILRLPKEFPFLIFPNSQADLVAASLEGETIYLIIFIYEPHDEVSSEIRHDSSDCRRIK